MNHATSPKLYRSYNPHRSRDSVSPVCGIFSLVMASQTLTAVHPANMFTCSRPQWAAGSTRGRFWKKYSIETRTQLLMYTLALLLGLSHIKWLWVESVCWLCLLFIFYHQCNAMFWLWLVDISLYIKNKWSGPHEPPDQLGPANWLWNSLHVGIVSNCLFQSCH